MKARSAIVAVLALAVAALGQRQHKDAELQTRLIALEKQSWEAWQKRDGKFYENLLSDDHVELGGSGRSTKKEVADFVGSPACVVKSYAVRDFEVTKFNESTALLTYHAEQDTTCHGK